LLEHLRSHGCELLREGAKDSIWWDPASRRTSTVPGHAEIFDQLARKIFKDLGIPTV
jgi:hypothetical protein